ncbi:MAG TPA: PIN domain-containing protein [Frankiaceae bacterium]|nr:PIN domain-containing protein [Frankiaceae bacterium]
MILCDTGPLVAAALSNDDAHRTCVDLFTGLHLAGRALLLPAPVTAEVGYLLAREAGPSVESLFLRSAADGDFEPVDLTVEDYGRMADLVEEYADLPLGTTDAAVIALAERLGVAEVATLDRRHFTVVRPRHVGALVLLP